MLPRRAALLPRSAGALALLTLALALPRLAHAKCEIQVLEVPVKMVGSRAVATVGINGTPVPLTVDSGAYYSMLTDAAAEQLKLRVDPNAGLRVQGLTGKVDAQLTTVDKLQLQKGEIPHAQFIVGGNEPGSGTMGLMGRNLLGLTDAEYDLAHGMIRLIVPSDGCETTNMAYWAGSAPVDEIALMVPFAARLPAIRARAKLNGHDVTAMFDTGATTIVSKRTALRIGLAETDMAPAGTMYGAGRGSGKLWTAPFESFQLGGEQVLNNRLRVGEFDWKDADMLLGIDFFLSHRIYVSQQQSKMFLTYAGGTVFSLNKGEAASAAPFDGAPSSDGAASSAPGAGTTADDFARRGATLSARREYEKALADLDRAVELDPTQAAFFAQRGGILASLNRPAKAMEDLDKALALDPAQVDARYGRAYLRHRMKDIDGAKADLDALDKTLSAQAQMRLAMARFYGNLELPAQQLAQLNLWLPAHPNEVRRDIALNSRCWARLQLGIELDKALEDCNAAVDADPKSPNHLDSRGWVNLRLGKYADALSDFDRSLKARPEGAWSHYGRALTKPHLGDAAGSAADLAAARKAEPDIDAKVARSHVTTEALPQP
jgi:tetratricopeptide (TPR) repeat protein/predicted aspartyl protease